MVKAIVFDQPGDSSVLKLADVNLPEPQGNEILLKHTAIEVNILDIAQRKGFNPLKGNILGTSAVGVVEAVGPEVKGFQVGSRVGFATKANGGGYAEKSIVNADICYNIPNEMPDNFAAATLGKALMAHTLTHRAYIVKPQHLIMVHAVDTALGQMICQWASYYSCGVIGTVSTNKNLDHAKKLGCYGVVNYNEPGWADQVMNISKGHGVHCVYDPLGDKTFLDSIKCICKIGIMVSYANLYGAINSIDPKLLSEKSLFLTFPNINDYKFDKRELLLSLDEVLINLQDKTLKPTLSAEVPLAEAAKAHDMIESGEATGSVVLIP